MSLNTTSPTFYLLKLEEMESREQFKRLGLVVGMICVCVCVS